MQQPDFDQLLITYQSSGEGLRTLLAALTLVRQAHELNTNPVQMAKDAREINYKNVVTAQNDIKRIMAENGYVLDTPKTATHD